MMRGVPILTAIPALFLFVASCSSRGNTGPKPKEYPFDHCAVIRKPFDEEEGAKYVRIHDGYRVGFCCAPCVRAFENNPEAFMGPIRAYYEEEEKPCRGAVAGIRE